MVEIEIPLCDACWESKAPWGWVRGFRDRLEIDGRVCCNLCGKPADMIVFTESLRFGTHPWLRPTLPDRVFRKHSVIGR